MRHALNLKWLTLLGLAAATVPGCASVDRHDSTAYPSVEKVATQPQTEAAAGLAVAPNPVLGSQTCTYDTPKGKVIVTISDTEKCSLKPPG